MYTVIEWESEKRMLSPLDKLQDSYSCLRIWVTLSGAQNVDSFSVDPLAACGLITVNLHSRKLSI